MHRTLIGRWTLKPSAGLISRSAADKCAQIKHFIQTAIKIAGICGFVSLPPVILFCRKELRLFKQFNVFHYGTDLG